MNICKLPSEAVFCDLSLSKVVKYTTADELQIQTLPFSEFSDFNGRGLTSLLVCVAMLKQYKSKLVFVCKTVYSETIR